MCFRLPPGHLPDETGYANVSPLHPAAPLDVDRRRVQFPATAGDGQSSSGERLCAGVGIATLCPFHAREPQECTNNREEDQQQGAMAVLAVDWHGDVAKEG